MDDNYEVVPLLNILDTGHRSTVVEWRAEFQLTIHPDFARSDRKFETIQTISSADVATYCSENERAVRLSKQSKKVW